MPKFVFFDEGPHGHFYGRHLGKGIQGCASLVIDPETGYFAVRKEAHSPKANNRSSDCAEIQNALKVQAAGPRCIPRLIRWARHKHCQTGKSFIVTYWEYYANGTLAEVVDRFVKERVKLPDQWIAFWLHEMLTAVCIAHDQGIVHTDAHLNNWFIGNESCSATLPHIVLGDWGLSLRKRDLTPAEWTRWVVEDFEFVSKGLRSLISAGGGGIDGRLLDINDKLRRNINRYHAGPPRELKSAMREVQAAVQRIYGHLRNGNARQISILEMAKKEPKYKAFNGDAIYHCQNLEDLKQYEVATSVPGSTKIKLLGLGPNCSSNYDKVEDAKAPR